MKKLYFDCIRRPNRETFDSINRANRETFNRLRQDPKFSDFFSFTFPDLKVGEKFAAGAQAEIYFGEFTLGVQTKFPCVLKIFAADYLIHLQRGWPEGMLKGGNSVFPGYFSGTSSILGGVLLEDEGFDGRFAIVLRREWGDLRKLIKLRMEQVGMGGPPFSDRCAKKMMFEIAMGMRQLHNHGILHRDLKSMNVLVCFPYAGHCENIVDDDFSVKVFDFESSGEVFGTGFWRAPEILQATREGTLDSQEPVSTKSDAYAYAMTCYEILTGKIPLEEHEYRSYEVILRDGKRPELPQGMDQWLRHLIQNCWHQDPSQRPTFDDIVNVFKANSSDPRTHTVEEQIAASRFYWTAKEDDVLECERNETNQEAFARLKRDPRYSSFFSYPFHNLEPKLKIAQGGQAEIFEAEFEKDNGIKVPCVLKIFDSGFSLSDMIRQWPPGMFRRGAGESSDAQRFGFVGLYPGATRTCEVLGAVVLEKSEKFGDGFADRFAFIFNREGGDLRTLIDLRMKQRNNQGPPFTFKFGTKVMHEIALGMQHLHDNDILHRDLKAANVLVTNVFGEFPTDVNTEVVDIKVADFECSMLVNGTNFWRAPEILRQLKSRGERTYTRKADVYSYGMTCYEVLTGGVPLEDRGFRRNDYEAVYRGERPILPDDADGWLRALIEGCWHSEPSERPEFKEIIKDLELNCSHLKHPSANGDSERGFTGGLFYLITLMVDLWNRLRDVTRSLR